MSEGSLSLLRKEEEDRLSRLLSCYLHKFLLFLLQAECVINEDNAEGETTAEYPVICDAMRQLEQLSSEFIRHV